MAESRRALATDDLHRRWMLADETPDDGWLEEYAAEAEEFYDVCGRGR